MLSDNNYDAFDLEKMKSLIKLINDEDQLDFVIYTITVSSMEFYNDPNNHMFTCEEVMDFYSRHKPVIYDTIFETYQTFYNLMKEDYVSGNKIEKAFISIEVNEKAKSFIEELRNGDIK